MIKLILKAILIIAILVFIYIMMRTKLVALHFKKGSKQNNKRNGGNKLLCPNCKTGKESYELDKHSDNCPYIGCFKDGKCKFYIPL